MGWPEPRRRARAISTKFKTAAASAVTIPEVTGVRDRRGLRENKDNWTDRSGFCKGSGNFHLPRIGAVCRGWVALAPTFDRRGMGWPEPRRRARAISTKFITAAASVVTIPEVTGVRDRRGLRENKDNWTDPIGILRLVGSFYFAFAPFCPLDNKSRIVCLHFSSQRLSLSHWLAPQ